MIQSVCRPSGSYWRHNYGVPAKLLNIIKGLHVSMKGTVRLNAGYSKPFVIKSGLHQVCVIAPNLFKLFFARVIAVAVEWASGLGIMFRFKINGKLFDPRRPRGAAELLARELLFADDAAIVSDNPSSLQEVMDCLVQSISEWGLTLTMGKTKVLYQPAPDDWSE